MIALQVDTDVTWKLLKTSPPSTGSGQRLAPLLAKERGTRKNSGSPSPCKEKGLGDVVHFLST